MGARYVVILRLAVERRGVSGLREGRGWIHLCHNPRPLLRHGGGRAGQKGIWQHPPGTQPRWDRGVTIEFDGAAPRGVEYTLDDMRRAGARLVAYKVKRS